jgi:Rieske 2Fe-2S family protein
MSDYPLHTVHVDQWGGFVFLNLSDEPRDSLQEFVGTEGDGLANWPLQQMVSVHREIQPLHCNWKLFWENYSECYHCPRHHPELCKLVPIYNEGLLSSYQPDGDERVTEDLQLGMGEGKVTWTIDGQTRLPFIDGLSPEDIEQGMVYASFTASMFVVGHPDYVRSVRIYPTGPETTNLVIDWYLLPGTKEEYPDEIDHMLELGRLVVEQDVGLSDLNQLGLKSRAFDQGVLVPQEYGVWDFHEWIRTRLE